MDYLDLGPARLTSKARREARRARLGVKRRAPIVMASLANTCPRQFPAAQPAHPPSAEPPSAASSSSPDRRRHLDQAGSRQALPQPPPPCAYAPIPMADIPGRFAAVMDSEHSQAALPTFGDTFGNVREPGEPRNPSKPHPETQNTGKNRLVRFFRVKVAERMGLAALRSGLRPMPAASPARLTAHRTASHPIRRKHRPAANLPTRQPASWPLKWRRGWDSKECFSSVCR